MLIDSWKWRLRYQKAVDWVSARVSLTLLLAVLYVPVTLVLAIILISMTSTMSGREYVGKYVKSEMELVEARLRLHHIQQEVMLLEELLERSSGQTDQCIGMLQAQTLTVAGGN